MNKTKQFSPEVREHAVRRVLEHRSEYPSLWSAVESIAPKIGCVPQTLLAWVKRHEVDAGTREGVTTAEAKLVKELERENKELGRANEILKLASALCPSGARPPTQVLRDFVDHHRDTFGVEPICKFLQIAPSGYCRYAALKREPQRGCARVRRDEALLPQIGRIWEQNMQVYGADKVWRQLGREDVPVAHCTVERLMRSQGMRGIVRGKRVRTTISDSTAACPLDKVNRHFKADRPNQLWVSDFTYVSTWQGWLYVAFVIYAFARRIIGWRVSTTMRTDFVLDALEQALYARQPARDSPLIHHSDRGSQYLSIRYSERLAEAGVKPSVGSRGDSYDNALDETINGLYKAELMHRRAPWKTREAVELATLEWVAWFNTQRLLAPIGYIPPAEAEANYYRQLASPVANAA